MIENNRFVDTGYAPTYNQTVSLANIQSLIRMQLAITLNCGFGNQITGNSFVGGINHVIFLSRNKACAGPTAGNVVSKNRSFGFREEGITMDASPNTDIGAFLVYDLVSSITSTTVRSRPRWAPQATGR